MTVGAVARLPSPHDVAYAAGLHRRAVTSIPSIADHGAIGDLKNAALVTNEDELDWLCARTFESMKILADARSTSCA